MLGDKRYVGTDNKVYKIAAAMIDTGYNATYVYAFLENHSDGVFGCKGKDYLSHGETYQWFSPAATQRIGGLNVLHVSTGKLKDIISNAMTASFWDREHPQPWWYPNFREDFGDDYFKQFEAESRKEVREAVSKRFLRYAWVQKFGQDNHAFDTYVYNLACLELIAEGWCKQHLGLPTLDWVAFWENAKHGEFYELGG